jgi:hypothetical protein
VQSAEGEALTKRSSLCLEFLFLLPRLVNGWCFLICDLHLHIIDSGELAIMAGGIWHLALSIVTGLWLRIGKWPMIAPRRL